MALSVCHKSVFCRNGWTNRAGFFCTGASFNLSYTVFIIRKSGTFKNRGTSFWNFAPNSKLRKILPEHVDRRSELPTWLEKGRRPERDKLGRRQSTFVNMHMSTPLYSKRWTRLLCTQDEICYLQTFFSMDSSPASELALPEISSRSSAKWNASIWTRRPSVRGSSTVNCVSKTVSISSQWRAFSVGLRKLVITDNCRHHAQTGMWPYGQLRDALLIGWNAIKWHSSLTNGERVTVDRSILQYRTVTWPRIIVS